MQKIGSSLLTAEVISTQGLSHARKPERSATERRLEAVGCRALILIEAPSPADHRGMLRAGKQCHEQGGDLNEILHYPAPILLWHRPARPYHVCLYPRPGRQCSRAPQHENRPGGLPESYCPV